MTRRLRLLLAIQPALGFLLALAIGVAVPALLVVGLRR